MSITTERKDALIKEHGRGKADTGSTEVAGRDSDRAHQQSDLAFQDARQGQPFASRLLMMVNQRRSLLDYLRGKAPQRYTDLIAKLGLRK